MTNDIALVKLSKPVDISGSDIHVSGLLLLHQIYLNIDTMIEIR